MRLIDHLARWITPRQKANPAGEGNFHPGPYTVNGGWLPHDWGMWNFWQADRDPLPFSGSSIVEACVWAYVRAIAQLPGFHRRELANGGTETITTSALARLLRAPNGYQTPSDFLVHIVRSLLLNGNSYSVAQRNERGEVEALHWTDPRQCRVREVIVDGQTARELFYEIGDNPIFQFERQIGRQSAIVPARDVMHIKLATPRHPLIGETWLAALFPEVAQRNAINTNLLTMAHNMRPTGVIQAPMRLTEAQLEEAREKWNKQAAMITSGGVPILTAGAEFKPISMSVEDQKIIEQMQLTNQAVAAVFGVPPLILGISTTATQKSAEAVMAEWLASGLGWMINHIELALDSFLGLNAESIGAAREFTEFDTRALLRSLFKEQIDGLARSVQAGIHAPNDARNAIGLAAVKDGDMPRVQQQMVPLDFAPPSPAAPAPPAPADDDPDEQRALFAHRLRKQINERMAA
jgi:HK97 family phage portal protein